MTLPTVSIIMPTLNSVRALEQGLSSITAQHYPKNKIEIIICDGGSTDSTLAVAKKFGAKILQNPLKTGEAGKAVGLKKAKGAVVAFIDSDNVLPEKNWLKKMVAPFNDRSIACSEPIQYTWRKKDNYITRYCALMGLNDPLVYFVGNYDRYNYLDRKWTRSKVLQEQKKGYLKARALEKPFPTIGANGFMARKSALKGFLKEDYFFDVDAGARLVAAPNSFFAKVDTGILHLYTRSFSTFVRKQKRRISDFLYYSNTKRKKSSSASIPLRAVAKFSLYTILVFPVLIQAFIGYAGKQDSAWFFHVPASIATLLIYAGVFLGSKFFGVKEFDRKKWSQ